MVPSKGPVEDPGNRRVKEASGVHVHQVRNPFRYERNMHMKEHFSAYQWCLSKEITIFAGGKVRSLQARNSGVRYKSGLQDHTCLPAYETKSHELQ